LALLAGVAGAAAHFLAHPHSVMPMIGASAAVSGMTAAAARFVFSPARLYGGPQDWLAQDQHGPSQSLSEMMRNQRAMLFLGVWFATNLVFGVTAAPLGITDASIAWEAHLGGFIIGLLLFPLLDGSRRGSMTT
jgi:membrane associated rhomboid family serine protease